MTLSAILPYLLVVGGYFLRHYEVGSKLAGLLGGPNPSSPATGGDKPLPQPPPPPAAPGSHPVLSDAVHSAVRQLVADVVAGHIVSLRSEIVAIAKAAADAAVANIQQQEATILPLPQNTTKH